MESDTVTGMDSARQELARTVSLIEPLDEVEAGHREAVLEWIGSGARLYRTRPPDDPPMHLVSYFVPYDEVSQVLMLVAHRKSGLDLPPGGHGEPGESAWTTVARECVEELGVAAVPVPWAGTAPLFVTVTSTRPPGSHTDVSLWHLVAVGRDDPRLRPDEREFAEVRWADPGAVLTEPLEGLDPNMHRFVTKLRALAPRT